MDGHALPIDELKGSKAVEVIDLSGKRLGVVSAVIIAACIGGNASLKTLKCAYLPKMAGRPASAAADAGRAPRVPSLALFGSLRSNDLGPEGGAALAKGLEGNATLTSLECAAMPCTWHIRKVLGLADQRQQPLTLVG